MKNILLFVSIIFPTILFSQIPVEFIENKGQWDQKALYKAEIQGGALWLESNAFTYDFISQEDLDDFSVGWHGENREAFAESARFRHHVYKVVFEGASSETQYTSKENLKKYNNYFIGSDPSKWAGKVPVSKRVYGKDLYPGIDLETYSSNGHLKYDFIVHPGADPSQLSMRYEGVEIAIKKQHLEIAMSIGMVIENEPIAYQMINNKRVNVACAFDLKQNKLTFHFPKGYNESYDLIIDPELIFSTYSGSTASNYGFTATYDDDGFFYGGGIVFAAGYPTTTGAYQTDFAANTDCGISKYMEGGTDQVFATYLGGAVGADNPHSLMVDSDNNLVVFGSTSSSDFPTSEGAYDEDFNGDYDIFITKFDDDGGDLLASTFLGGSGSDGRNTSGVLSHNYGDGARGEVFVAANDQIFIASCTNSDDMPTTGASEEQDSQGGLDGCAFLFNSTLDSMLYGTYLGGSTDDAAYSVKSENGVIVVAGGTTSNDFPVSSDVLVPTYLGGSSDGFILTLNNFGGIIKSTYTGTDEYDQVYFVDFGVNNTLFVAGQTTGDFTVTPGVYSNEGGTQFIQELNIDLTQNLRSTVFGTGGANTDISLTAFMVDVCGHAYVSGFGTTNGLPVTPDAFQPTSQSNDFYFIVFETDFEDLLYATFFGGATTSEHVDGGTSRFDDNGIIYQAVCVCGADFPVTEDAYATASGGGCNLGSIKMEFNFLGLNFKNQIEDTLFCDNPPYIIPFEGAGDLIANHYWDFGDGGSANEPNPMHEYIEPGIYDIEYIVVDSNSCFIADTANYQIEIAQKEAFSFEYETTNPSPCSDTLWVEMAFTGTSADYISWDMDDGTMYFTPEISHNYTQPGEYLVTMTATDLHCDHSETLEQLYTLYDQSLIGDVLIPNIFSPNNDRINDEFRLFNSNGEDPLENLEYYSVQIFDRWGVPVFESGDTIKDWVWDGTVNEKDADEGVYFYTMKYNNLCESSELITISGYVTLVR
jgi:gliding motility-associated-like protein